MITLILCINLTCIMYRILCRNIISEFSFVNTLLLNIIYIIKYYIKLELHYFLIYPISNLVNNYIDKIKYAHIITFFPI